MAIRFSKNLMVRNLAIPAFITLFIFFLSIPGRADEDSTELTTQQAKDKVASFNQSFKVTGKTLPAIEEHEKRQEIRRLGKYDHELIVKRMSLLLREKIKTYRLEAAKALGRLKSSPKTATRGLSKVLSVKEEDGPFLAAVIRALGFHRHRKSLDIIGKCLDHPSDEVFMASIWAMGEIRNLTSTKVLLPVFELNIMDRAKGVNVRVDTGAAGNGDRAAAAAKGKSRQKKRRPNQQKILEEIRSALEKMTGERLEKPENLREWMDVNKKKIKAAKRR